MKRGAQRTLSLLLAVVMVVGMLPAMAMAASVPPAQTMANDNEVDTSRYPIYTAYKLYTGETLPDDGEYIIVNKSGTAGNKKVLFHTGSSDTTDQITATISGDTASLDASGKWADSTQLWQVAKSGSGYTVKSQNDNKFLNINGTVGRCPVTATSQELTITKADGGFTVSRNVGGTDLYIYRPDDNGTHYSVSTNSAVLEFYKKTEVQFELAEVEFSGESSEPMSLEDVGTNYFRIPGIATLANGWLVASSDVRWNSDVDNPQNIDTIVSVSKDGGETWDWEVINYMSDYAEGVSNYNSAAFIDPAILATSNNEVWVVSDITPFHFETGRPNDRHSYSTTGTGYDGDTNAILVTKMSEAGIGKKTPMDPDQYHYRIEVDPRNGASAKMTKDAWGRERVVYPITPVDGYTDTDHLADGMYADAYFNLYETVEGEIVPVYCVQQGAANTCTQNNLFYSQSEWRIFPTFYLCMRKGTVNESTGGIDWDDPIYPNVRHLGQNHYFMAVCPGRGLAFDYYDEETGKTHERLVFACYDSNTGGEKASTIYSDDGGVTWNRGSGYWNNNANSSYASGESQIIQMPGTNRLRMYSRNGQTTFIYAESTDGGDTWGDARFEQSGFTYASNCMTSFINLKGSLVNTATNQEYDHVYLASYPRGSGRNNGRVRAGYYDEGRDTIVWLNEFAPDDHYNPSTFAYSCLTQYTEDGEGTDRIGWLHEHTRNSGSGTYIEFMSFSLNDNLQTGWVFTTGGSINISVPLYSERKSILVGADASQVDEIRRSLTSQLEDSGIVSLDRVDVEGDADGQNRQVVVAFTGRKEGAVEVRYGGYTYSIVVHLPQNMVSAELVLGDKPWQCSTHHSSGEITIGSETGAVHAVSEAVTTDGFRGLGVQRYANDSFGGAKLLLEDALYTAESYDGGISLRAMTQEGETIYLSIGNGSVGCPTNAAPAKITVSAGQQANYLTLKDTSTLFFHTQMFTDNVRYLVFDRQTNPETASPYRTDFLIFTPDNISGTTASEVFEGYYQVTSAAQVQAGHQYFIARQANDGNYYVLFPASTTTDKTAHVVKYIGETEFESITNYRLNVTPIRAGVQDVVIDGVLHRFTVVGTREIDVYVDLGETYDGVYPHETDSESFFPVGSSATVKWIQKTYQDNVQVGTGASYSNGGAFGGAITRIRDCLFVFKQTGGDSTDTRTFDIYSASNPSRHAYLATAIGQPIQGTAGSWTIETSSIKDMFFLKDGSSYLYMHLGTDANNAYRFNRFSLATNAAEQCSFALFTRDKHAGFENEEPVTDIPGLTDFYRVTSLDQIVDGTQYLIARVDGDSVYLLYPPESSTADYYTYVAKVLKDTDIGNTTHTDYYLQATGDHLGVTELTVGNVVYRIHVVGSVTVSGEGHDHLTIEGVPANKVDGTEDVVITITPDRGYSVGTPTVTIGGDTAEAGTHYTVETDEAGVVTLTILAGFKSNVAVSVSSAAKTLRAVTLRVNDGAQSTHHLTAARDGEPLADGKAYSGDVIRITCAGPDPDNTGKILDSLEITGGVQATFVKEGDDGYFTFVMPDADITVTGKVLPVLTAVTISGDILKVRRHLTAAVTTGDGVPVDDNSKVRFQWYHQDYGTLWVICSGNDEGNQTYNKLVSTQDQGKKVKVTAWGDGENYASRVIVEAETEDVIAPADVAPETVTITRNQITMRHNAEEDPDGIANNANEGKTTVLTATVNPENATNWIVEWESSDTGVATVEPASGTVAEGNTATTTVTAVAAGTATITVRARSTEEDDPLVATVAINVQTQVESLEWVDGYAPTECTDTDGVPDTFVIYVNQGENSTTAKVRVEPQGAGNKSLTWKRVDENSSPAVTISGLTVDSDDGGVHSSGDGVTITATLDEDALGGGALNVGRATFKVTSDDNAKASKTFYVEVRRRLENPVSITGTPKFGETLGVNLTQLVITKEGEEALRYQWLRDGEEIDGADDMTYTLIKDDVGKEISVRITADPDTYFEGTRTSAAVTVDKADALVIPGGSIRGIRATSGDDDNGRIIGLVPEVKYEYQSVDMDAGNDPWEVVEDESEIIVPAGTYRIRIWFDPDTHYPSEFITVIVPTHDSTCHAVIITSTAGGNVYAVPDQADQGDTVTLTIRPAANYQLRSLTVTPAGGEAIIPDKISENEYTFEMPDSDVIVSAEFGPVKVKIYHDLSEGLSCSLKDSHEDDEGKAYHEVDYSSGVFTITLKAAEGYDLPINIRVTRRTGTGEELGTDYVQYDRSTGVITFPNGVTEDITITATAVKKTYSVSLSDNSSNVTLSGSPTVTHGDTFEGTLVLNVNGPGRYELPETITVTMDGKPLTEGDDENGDYTYASDTGIITIPNVTGIVVITAEAVRITTPVMGVTITGNAAVGSTLTANVDPDNAQVHFQWLRDGAPISGAADGNTYQLTGADLNAKISVKVTGYGDYSGVVTSDQYGPVVDRVIAPTGITLDKKDAILEFGQTLQLTATVQPPEATDKSVTWSVVSGDAVTVRNGLVTAQKIGTAIVQASNAAGYTASCEVTVTAAQVGVTLSGDAKVGKTLTAAVTPEGAVSSSTIRWYRMDGSNGGDGLLLTANNNKTTYIPVAADAGYQIKVTVEGAGNYTGVANAVTEGVIVDEGAGTPDICTVIFDSQGGSLVASKTVAKGGTVSKPADPTKDGYTFEGWYTDEACTERYDFTKPVISDLTLYAKWTKNSAGPGPSAGSNPSTSPSTTTTTETNEDGSVTTTVTNNVTGTVTETTEKPDGSVVTVETKADGTVTKTVVDAAGAKTEKVTDPEDNVTITVTDSKGEELAKVEIPAVIPAPENRFDDIDQTPWAEEAINNVAGLMLVKGVGDNKYDPTASMTRGALATVLFRLSQGKTDYNNTFSDVAQGQYYTEGVAWAARVNVVTGYSADIFAPNDTITREQLAVMLARYARLIGMDITADASALDGFVDGNSTDSWAVDGMAWCVKQGILRGRGANNLDPTANVTRAEVAVMLDRFIALIK